MRQAGHRTFFFVGGIPVQVDILQALCIGNLWAIQWSAHPALDVHSEAVDPLGSDGGEGLLHGLRIDLRVPNHC